MGATNGIDSAQYKIECFPQLFTVRRWSFAVVPDLRFSQSGVREYEWHGRFGSGSGGRVPGTRHRPGVARKRGHGRPQAAEMIGSAELLE